MSSAPTSIGAGALRLVALVLELGVEARFGLRRRLRAAQGREGSGQHAGSCAEQQRGRHVDVSGWARGTIEGVAEKFHRAGWDVMHHAGDQRAAPYLTFKPRPERTLKPRLEYR